MTQVEYQYPDLVWRDEYPNGVVYTCIFFRPLPNFCTLKEVKESVISAWYTEKEFKEYFPELYKGYQE